jgi:hypothetical protein
MREKRGEVKSYHEEGVKGEGGMKERKGGRGMKERRCMLVTSTQLLSLSYTFHVRCMDARRSRGDTTCDRTLSQ